MTSRRPPRLPRWASASVTTGTPPVIPPLPDGPQVVVHIERAIAPDGTDYTPQLAAAIAALIAPTTRSTR